MASRTRWPATATTVSVTSSPINNFSPGFLLRTNMLHLLETGRRVSGL
jgi:hypothetical protein